MISGGEGAPSTLAYNVPTAYPPPRSWAGDLTAYADQLYFKQ